MSESGEKQVTQIFFFEIREEVLVAEQKEQILAADINERSNMRGIQRTFDISRNTLIHWRVGSKKTGKTQSLKRRCFRHSLRVFSK